MATGFKFMNRLRAISSSRKLISVAAVTALSAKAGVVKENNVTEKENPQKEEIGKKEMEQKLEFEIEKQLAREANTRNFGKDTVVFLTKEEASGNSKVLVPKVQVTEDRAPYFDDGSINWACGCIEKDVIGPCNLEFREFRLMVDKRRHNDDMPFSDDDLQIFRNFLHCARSNPVYYSSLNKMADDDGVVDDAETSEKN
ncbi:Mitochondrial intermembrane space import and assembly protein 40 [Mactra antiquata]